MRGVFIAFEGIDGSGSTTQCAHLYHRLKDDAVDVVLTREPGGTPLGERLREAVLSPELDDVDSLAELLIIVAARRQHAQQLIVPALARGKHVISERYAASSVAYQGAGRGVERNIVDRVNELAVGDCSPDIVILLDLNVELALGRRKGQREDRIEAAGVEFQMRVRESYCVQAAADPEKWWLLDATQDEQKLSEVIYNGLRERFPTLVSDVAQQE
ncbi:MAG: dTMP kinase [Candidatus Latescibacterota bacterium]|nr:dTMP kinase [Candidatus Latescibacterota bacterium]